MSSGSIPHRFPLADGDRILACAVELNLGMFAVGTEMEFSHNLDAERLCHALDLTLDAQPILGCRFVAKGKQRYWERLDKNERKVLYLAGNEQEYENFRTLYLDSRAGPQVKACLHRLPGGDRLILKVSHQVCDGRGFHDIAATVSDIYNRLAHDPDYVPEPNINGARDSRQIFRLLPWSAFPVILFNFLKLLWSNNVPAATHSLPLISDPHEPLTYNFVHIPRSRTTRLAEYGKKHNATINDLIITAFLRALIQVGKWDGRSALRIQMTTDLRQWYLPAKGGGGICNLTGFEYVNLGTDPGSDFEATLARTNAITRARKASYFGLSEVCLVPLLNLLPHNWLVKMLGWITRQRTAQKNLPPALTNVGPIPPEILTFDQPPRNAWGLPPVIYPPSFSLGVTGYAGSMTLSAGFCKSSAAIIGAFMEQMANELPA